MQLPTQPGSVDGDVRPLAVQEDGYSTEDEPLPFDEQCSAKD